MIGTLINVAAILIGGSIGLLFGNRLPDKLKSSVTAGMGIFVAVTGIKMFLETQNSLIVLGSVVLGVLLGEWWKIEDGLQHLGEAIEKRISQPKPENQKDASNAASATTSNFVRGFITASLLFCIGPIAILGSIQAGLKGDVNLLVIKSVLDGFASMAFASTLGVGVLFSAGMILIYQGGITLLAAQLNSIATQSMLSELTATGGILLLGIAISSLLEIKKIRVGNFLPALLLAPLTVWVISLLGRVR